MLRVAHRTKLQIEKLLYFSQVHRLAYFGQMRTSKISRLLNATNQIFAEELRADPKLLESEPRAIARWSARLSALDLLVFDLEVRVRSIPLHSLSTKELIPLFECADKALWWLLDNLEAASSIVAGEEPKPARGFRTQPRKRSHPRARRPPAIPPERPIDLKRLPKYAQGVDPRRLVRLLCKRHCYRVRWAEMDQDYPGRDALLFAPLNKFTAQCSKCRGFAGDCYNWFR